MQGDLWLGHDEPQYKVTWNWIFQRQDNLWLHLKNAAAAKTLDVFQSFCHTDDPYCYTSKGKIWLHDLNQTFDDKTIIVVSCKRSSSPAFLEVNDEENFFIRLGPSSRKLSTRSTIEYLKAHPFSKREV